MVIISQGSLELQNGATRGQPGLLVPGRTMVTDDCCFHYGLSGMTGGADGSTIKMHFLFKVG